MVLMACNYNRTELFVIFTLQFGWDFCIEQIREGGHITSPPLSTNLTPDDSFL
jgi:hypothetical protein